MTGQPDLQAASEGSSVQCCDDRPAQRLQAPQVGFDGGDARPELGRVVSCHPGQEPEVAAGEEGVLRRGEDDASDRVLLGV